MAREFCAWSDSNSSGSCTICTIQIGSNWLRMTTQILTQSHIQFACTVAMVSIVWLSFADSNEWNSSAFFSVGSFFYVNVPTNSFSLTLNHPHLSNELKLYNTTAPRHKDPKPNHNCYVNKWKIHREISHFMNTNTPIADIAMTKHHKIIANFFPVPTNETNNLNNISNDNLILHFLSERSLCTQTNDNSISWPCNFVRKYFQRLKRDYHMVLKHDILVWIFHYSTSEVVLFNIQF